MLLPYNNITRIEKIKMTTKEKVLNAVAELPKDVEFEDILERLYFIYKVETGLNQVPAGDTLSHTEVIQNIKSWQE